MDQQVSQELQAQQVKKLNLLCLFEYFLKHILIIKKIYQGFRGQKGYKGAEGNEGNIFKCTFLKELIIK